ncbi:hypothetical protein [Tropicimonas sp. IMCC6043]|uniref:hypothetical protein n=1 Tax=Tropicimonas sp. IMCC6043 TaxID=2510645 RepID=UPI00101E0774|nr:hypothetical protein [Tropicimonas sp. IMCC6043]RYH11541.1 hypothetical protein EU800_02570 [Tropicimonas sp. IMCC6043]
MTLHGRIDPDMTAGDETGDLMECAYATLMAQRTSFSPEDFALYFLSCLLDRVDPRDRDGFRRGAAGYLLKNRARLSRDFRALSDEAQALLSRPLTEVSADDAPPVPDNDQEAFVESGTLDDFVFDFGRENASLALLLTQPVHLPQP